MYLQAFTWSIMPCRIFISTIHWKFRCIALPYSSPGETAITRKRRRRNSPVSWTILGCSARVFISLSHRLLPISLLFQYAREAETFSSRRTFSLYCFFFLSFMLSLEYHKRKLRKGL